VKRLANRRCLAAAVTHHHDVRRQQLHEAIQVPFRDRGEEPLGQLLLVRARGLEPRPAGLDVATAIWRHLSSVLWTKAATSSYAKPKTSRKRKDRPLDRGQALEKD
jgi:hypothetical protein